MRMLAPAGDTRKIAAPPVSIGCLACRGQFFAASLPIHQRTCFQRNAFVLVPCEKCKACVRACEFHAHFASCSGKVLPQENTPGVCDNNAEPDTNQCQQVPISLNLPETDGRVRCKICERAFSQDRISKHQSVCHGKPRSIKERHKPRQVLVPADALRNSTVTQLAERPRRRTPHIQRILASQPRKLSLTFTLVTKDRGEWGDSARNRADVVAPSSSRQSGTYPGAEGMQAGRWDTSNASSTSNPLVTNSLMTMPR